MKHEEAVHENYGCVYCKLRNVEFFAAVLKITFKFQVQKIPPP